MCKVYQISIRDNMEGATRTFLISSEQVKSRFSAIKYTLNKLELNNAIVTDVLDDTDEKMVAVINNGQYEAVVMKMMDGFVEITPEPKPAHEPRAIDPTKQEPVAQQPSIVPMKEPPTFEDTSTIEQASMPVSDGIDTFMSKLPSSISSPVRNVACDILRHVAEYPETLGQSHWQFGNSIFIMPFLIEGVFQLYVFDNGVSVRALDGNKEVYSVDINCIDLAKGFFRVENEKTTEGSAFTNEVINFIMKLKKCVHNPDIPSKS
jgi:hypothetical protein